MRPPQRLERGAWIRLGLTGLVLTAGVLAAIRFLDIEAIVTSVQDADPTLLVAATALYAVSWPIRGWRYRRILAAMDHGGSTRFLTYTIFLSQAANLLVPARAGDGLRAYLVKDRLEVPYAAGIASLLVERVLDLVAVAGIAGGAILLIFGTGGGLDIPALDGRFVAMGMAVAGLGLLAGGVGVALVRRPGWSAHLPAGIRSWLERLLAAMRRILGDNATVVATLGASAPIWLLDVAVGIVVGVAVLGPSGLGGALGFALAVTLAVSVGNLAKTIPITHGGLGMYEGAFLGVLVATTPISAELALAVAILDHGIKNALTLAGGCLVAVLLYGRLPRSREEVESPNF